MNEAKTILKQATMEYKTNARTQKVQEQAM
jgi:hypothetical protein